MIKMEFEGGRDLERALGQLGTQYRRKKPARDALMEAAEPIGEAIEAAAPVRVGGPEKTFKVAGSEERRIRRRGALKRHVNVGTRLSRRQARENRANKMPVEVYVGTRDRIARLVEFGTRDTPAQPYFRPAWDRLGGRHALRIIAEAMWRGIEKQVRLQARAIARGRK